ncbi:hypothetical protein ANN_10608 [Periplaneta americana]|uniref:DUF4817 domain-containing protein n=1 Tax=Periplaneta americana TaxID=6978 RepID=A0ABQ8TPT6_PERAM|nr:hypothetical protein ANN_10608 [Periplaneta americana]
MYVHELLVESLKFIRNTSTSKWADNRQATNFECTLTPCDLNCGFLLTNSDVYYANQDLRPYDGNFMFYLTTLATAEVISTSPDVPEFSPAGALLHANKSIDMSLLKCHRPGRNQTRNLEHRKPAQYQLANLVEHTMDYRDTEIENNTVKLFYSGHHLLLHTRQHKCIHPNSRNNKMLNMPNAIDNSHDEQLTAVCLKSIATRLFSPGRPIVISYPTSDLHSPETFPEESVLQYMDAALKILQENMLWPLQIYRMNFSVNDTDYFLNGLYIIFIDFKYGVRNVYDGIYNQINTIMTSGTYRSRRTFVVLISGFSNELMNAVRHISGDMWEVIGTADIFFLIPDYSSLTESGPENNLRNSKLEVFTWFPYNGGCGNSDDIQLIGQCSLDNNIFSENYYVSLNDVPKNLHGCPITVDMTEDDYYDLKIVKKIGVIYQDILAEFMNATLVVTKTNDRNTNKHYPPPDMFGSLNLFVVGVTEFFDPTISIISCDLKWYIPCPKSVVKMDKIMDVFSPGVWICTIVVVFLSAIVVWRSAIAHNFSILEAKTYRTLSSSLVNMLSVTIGVSVPELPRTPCLRSFFLLFVVFSLVLSTVFQCFFVSFLVSPGVSTRISTLDQLLRSDLKLGVPPELYYFVCGSYEDAELWLPSMNESVCSDMDSCLERLFTVADIATVTSSKEAQIYLAKSRGLVEHTEELLCSLDEDIVSSNYMFFIRRNSPIVDRFNTIALFSTFCVNVKMQYTLNQRLFLVKQYWITNSITATQRAYQREFGVRNPPKRNTILGLVNKLETNGSLNIATKLFPPRRPVVISYPSEWDYSIEKFPAESVLEYMDATLKILQQDMLWPLQIYQADTDVKEKDYFLNGFYIIFVNFKDYGSDFKHHVETQISIIKSRGAHRYRRTFVVLISGFIVEFMEAVRYLRGLVWRRFRTANVLFLIPHYFVSPESRVKYFLGESKLDVFTWLPYKRCYNPNDMKLIGQCSVDNNIFSENIDVFLNNVPKDLNGCPITVELGDDQIDDYKIVNKIGVFHQELLAEYMNSSIAIRNYSYTNENSILADMIGGLNIFAMEGLESFDPAVSILSCDMKWYVPCPKYVPRMDRIMDVFSPDVWICTIGVVFVSALVVWRSAIAHHVSVLEAQTYRTLSSSLINLLSVTISVSVPELPRTPSLRVFFLLFILFSLVLSTVFQCFFVSFLISPGFSTRISTFEQLLASGLKLEFPPELNGFVVNTYGYEFWNSTKSASVCSNMQACLERLFTVGDIATITSFKEVQIFLARTRGLVDHVEEMFCSLDENILSTNYMFFIRRNSPIVDRFNTLSVRCVESGIINMHFGKILANITSKNEDKSFHFGCEDCSDFYFVFTLSHLRATFLFLLFGNLFAFIVFIGELLFNCLSAEKTVDRSCKCNCLAPTISRFNSPGLILWVFVKNRVFADFFGEADMLRTVDRSCKSNCLAPTISRFNSPGLILWVFVKNRVFADFFGEADMLRTDYGQLQNFTVNG